MSRRQARTGRGITMVCAVFLLGAAPGAFAGLTGTYTGQLDVVPAAQTVDAAAALTDAAGTLSGTVVFALSDPALGAAFLVQGRSLGRRLRLTGMNPAGVRLVLRGVVTNAGMRGAVRVRGVAAHAKGRFTLRPRATGGDGSACDPVFTQNTQLFTTQVMDGVLVPVCSACHVAGGQAQATRFLVVRGDPAATARSTALVINQSDPTASLLLAKPLASVAHGGGRQVTAGSTQAQILQQWVDLIVQAACSATSAGVSAAGDPYAARCAGCHGADGSGLPGRPDVRCTVRSLLADAVRRGRGHGPDAMPAFALSDLPVSELGMIASHLQGLCSGRAEDIYASNCASCHGATAGGGRNADGVGGPDIRCSEGGGFGEVLRGGEDGMPAFPSFSTAQVSAISRYVHGFCGPGGGGGE